MAPRRAGSRRSGATSDGSWWRRHPRLASRAREHLEARALARTPLAQFQRQKRLQLSSPARRQQCRHPAAAAARAAPRQALQRPRLLAARQGRCRPWTAAGCWPYAPRCRCWWRPWGWGCASWRQPSHLQSRTAMAMQWRPCSTVSLGVPPRAGLCERRKTCGRQLGLFPCSTRQAACPAACPAADAVQPASAPLPPPHDAGAALPTAGQLALAVAVAAGVTAARTALLASWPDFREASDRSNQQVRDAWRARCAQQVPPGPLLPTGHPPACPSARGWPQGRERLKQAGARACEPGVLSRQAPLPAPPTAQVLAPLAPADVLLVAGLPAVSEEVLFRGALIPAIYPDWWVV